MDSLHGCPVIDVLGQRVLYVGRDNYIDLMKKLADDGFNVAIDVTAIDFLTHPNHAVPDGVTAERFELVVQLLSIAKSERIRVKVQVPENDATVPTLFDLHPTAEALEREVFDMFGISFDGHPDLTRILMPEDWDGHPLRKDYSVGRIPVQFKGSPA